jgi:hypothetical protein
MRLVDYSVYLFYDFYSVLGLEVSLIGILSSIPGLFENLHIFT